MKNANAKNLVIENLEGTVAEGEEVEIIEPNSTAVRTFFFHMQFLVHQQIKPTPNQWLQCFAQHQNKPLRKGIAPIRKLRKENRLSIT